MRRNPPSRFDHVDLTPQPLPADLSAVTCRAALGWWIDCRCTGPGCHGGSTHYPVRMLLERYNCDGVRLLDVAKRLRCRQCRSKPSGLSLIDDAAGGVYGMRMKPPGGGPETTAHDLLPYLAAEARCPRGALPVTGTTWLVPFTRGELERDPAKRRLLEETFALERVEGGPLLSTDRGLGSGKLGAGQG